MNLEKRWLIHKTELWECHDEAMSPPPRNLILWVYKILPILAEILREVKRTVLFPNFDQEVVKIVAVEMRVKRKTSAIWHDSVMHVKSWGTERMPQSAPQIVNSPFFLCQGGLHTLTQSCLTLCDPKDCSLPGSSVHGILQAIILEWVASSRGSSLVSWIGRWILYH